MARLNRNGSNFKVIPGGKSSTYSKTDILIACNMLVTLSIVIYLLYRG